jgi:hypothetical protein
LSATLWVMRKRLDHACYVVRERSSCEAKAAHGRYQFATYGGTTGYVWLQDVYHEANPGPVSTQNPRDTLSYDAALTQNPSTNVLNARLGVTIGKLDLSLFVNNLLNSHPLLDHFHALAFDDRLQATTYER